MPVATLMMTLVYDCIGSNGPQYTLAKKRKKRLIKNT